VASTDRLNTHPVPSPRGIPTPIPARSVVEPAKLCNVTLTVPFLVVLNDRDVAPPLARLVDQVTLSVVRVVGVVGVSSSLQAAPVKAESRTRTRASDWERVTNLMVQG
jgi:hypothetical protein